MTTSGQHEFVRRRTNHLHSCNKSFKSRLNESLKGQIASHVRRCHNGTLRWFEEPYKFIGKLPYFLAHYRAFQREYLNTERMSG